MQRSTKIALAVGGALAAAAFAGRSASAEPTTNGDDDMGVSNRVRMWRKLEWVAELDDTQRYFLMLTAKGEGNYNPSAHNGSDGERAASAAALANNPSIAAKASACGVPLDNLRTGSWTTFQLLAPYVTGTAFEVFGGAACPFADPTRAPQNLNLQIVLAIEHARDLQGYQGFLARPTVGNLRLGWAAPGWMGYEGEHQDKIAKYRQLAIDEHLGLTLADAAQLVDKPIKRFPANPAQIYEALRTNGPL